MLKNELVLGAVALAAVLLVIFLSRGASLKGTNQESGKETTNQTGNLSQNNNASQQTARGSCDLTEQASTCVEYYGSYWMAEAIKLACQEGVFSTNGCPKPNMGGCRMNLGSETDMVTWYYDKGGGGFDQENIKYAMQSCNAVPGGAWTE